MENNSLNSTSNNSETHLNEAIPFITFNQATNKFIISEEAKEIICKPKYKKVGIISLVGKYRTGKSFLLNRVLINNKNLEKKGFDVGPTIRPCTKGIWLWTTPLLISNSHSKESFPTFLIDTEGLGAYDEEINHDSKIFLIAILISSLFIYNSFGTIDENALNNLSLIVNLSKSLKLTNNTFNKYYINEVEEMSKYFPSLLWLLRDFALKLEDSEGNVITAKQYLENALIEQKGNTETIEEKNTVRRLIKAYFPERDCFPMVRPVENENDLQNLQYLPDDKIRQEFLTQSETLRNKIFMKTKPKNFNGKILSSNMLMDLVENIIESINSGNIPVIENSWKYVISNKCLKNIDDIVKIYKERINNYQKKNLQNSEYFSELEKYNNNLIEELINNFKEENSIFDDVEQYIRKLRITLHQEYKKFNEGNTIIFKNKYSADLDKSIEELLNNKEKISKENYIVFLSELIQIKDKIDNSIPDFILKQNLGFEKILSSVKKYIDIYFLKPKNEYELKFQSLKNEKEILNSKYNEMSQEYNKDKIEFKQTVDKYNDMLVEYKLQNKSYEDRIKNFDNEKKLLKESNNNEKNLISREYDSKIEKLNMEINRLKNEIKTKEDEILLNNLNYEKESALNKQKTEFLEKEVNQWKDRFNNQSKNLSELKSQIIDLNAEIDKNKTEIKNLKSKLLQTLNNKNNNNNLNKSTIPARNNNNNSDNLLNNSLNLNLASNSTGMLNILLAGQNDIKDMLKNLQETNNKILNSNNKIYDKINNNNNTTNFNLNKINKQKNKLSENISEDSFEDKNKTPFKSNTIFSLNPNSNNSNKDNKDNNFFNKTLTLNKKDNLKSDKTEELLFYIKILSSNKKKDENSNKFYIEYKIEVHYKENKWNINKKYENIFQLNKNIKNLFKDLILLPFSDDIFTNNLNINEQQDNITKRIEEYLNELGKNDIILLSAPFKNFFEIDDNLVNHNKKDIIEDKSINSLNTTSKRDNSNSRNNQRKISVPIRKKMYVSQNSLNNNNQ